jgi:hypothetical protein
MGDHFPVTKASPGSVIRMVAPVLLLRNVITVLASYRNPAHAIQKLDEVRRDVPAPKAERG